MNFWKTGIEEQCNLLFSSNTIPLIHLNVSIVKWRSNFNITVFGNDNYGIGTVEVQRAWLEKELISLQEFVGSFDTNFTTEPD